MSQAGLLVRVDGSRHDWLQGRGSSLTLVGGIDDATGIMTGAVCREQEDVGGYIEALTLAGPGNRFPSAPEVSTGGTSLGGLIHEDHGLAG